jgi:hypothetical protein
VPRDAALRGEADGAGDGISLAIPSNRSTEQKDFSTGLKPSSKGEAMPLVTLLKGHSLKLNEGDHDSVVNPHTQEGKYVLSFNLMPLSIQHMILPHAHQAFIVPKGGASVENNGPVDLVVITPGL